MATANDDNNLSRTFNQKEINIYNNNRNDKSNNNNKVNIPQFDHSDDKGKKEFLEQRKQSLESLLREKFWFLQQIQKKEIQILNGDYEYINLNDIFLSLENQYKHEINGFLKTIGPETTSILRRKSFICNQDHQSNNNIHTYNSNRTSEYDNCPGNPPIDLKGSYEQHKNENNELAEKTAANKRSVPNTSMNVHYLHMQNSQQQPCIHKQIEDSFIPHQNDEKQKFSSHQTHLNLLQQSDKILHLQQIHQHHKLTNDNNFLTVSQSHCIPQTHLRQSDGISLISVNSANNAHLLKKNISSQPQAMIIQSDKYYLSPTHQSYNEGNFIKCSQNIKKYVSPVNSPITCTTRIYGHSKYDVQHLHQLYKEHQSSPLQQLESQVFDTKNQYHQRPIDIISLDPSYTSMDSDPIQNLRWRSQTSIPLSVSSIQNQDIKSNSSDILSYMTTSPPNLHSNESKKPFDEISICSLNNEMQKKTKPKQWTESSLDGPIIRLQVNCNDKLSHSGNQQIHKDINVELPNIRLTPKSQVVRERNKLSSQSMSSGRYYLKSDHKDHNAFQYFQNNDGRYSKLSQSTSFLNSSEHFPVFQIDATPIHVRNQKPARSPSTVSLLNSSFPLSVNLPSSSFSPDIRIESPKNMTVVQQATFQPYKEITKPFEMSDFYKYSTKFRQRESTGSSKMN